MKNKNLLFLIILLPVILHSQGQQSLRIETEVNEFNLHLLTKDLNHPWSLALLPDNEGILITERRGNLYLFHEDKLIEIQGLPAISAIGQGGLLDIVLDGDFTGNRIVYFSFTESGIGGYGTAVGKAVLENNKLDKMEVIFRAIPKSSGGIHFGSRLLFGVDGYLYITLGERGVMDNAQNLAHHGGSVIRIDTNGNIPPDNPFTAADNSFDEIYSFGHRNAQGIALNERTGDIWLHEHGPKGGDEVNILKGGANYGWPLVTYGINYDGSIISNSSSQEGIEEPVIFWVPSIAPSGMAFYYGDKFPMWKGNIFVGALAGRHLRRLVLSDNEVTHEEILLKNEIGRIRDVRTGPEGMIYLLTDEKKGALYRIEPILDE